MRDALRIGGEFELDPADFLGDPSATPPGLPAPFARWTDTGRSALLLAAQDILRCGGRPVAWLPGFCCPAVVQPFRQAGFDVKFYTASEVHGVEGAEPDPRPGETLLFVHYFGRLNRRRVAQARRWQHEGVRVVEDAAHAALTDGVGAAGDYAITSLRKLLPQPDGALIVSREPLPAMLAGADEAFVSARLLAKLLRGTKCADGHFLPLLAQSEARLDGVDIVPREMSWLSRQLMSRTDTGAVAARRRVNQASLRRALVDEGSDHLSLLFGDPAEGEVPLGLPVRVLGGRRDDLRRFLSEHSVFCPIHWLADHLPDDAALAPDRELAAQILTLPIDQRMGEAHVERLVGLVGLFFRRLS